MRVALEQGPILLQRAPELIGLVGGAEATPGDEIGARRDRRRRVDLQQGQLLHDREQVGGPRRVEELRAHRDAPGLRPGQPVHGEEATSGRVADLLQAVEDQVEPELERAHVAVRALVEVLLGVFVEVRDTPRR